MHSRDFIRLFAEIWSLLKYLCVCFTLYITKKQSLLADTFFIGSSTEITSL